MTIDEYIESCIDAEPAHLRRLYRQTHLQRLYARMCTDHVQGRTLAMLTKMIQPERVLELGTFSGYSTLCFAEAGCAVDTVEVDDEHVDELTELFADYPGVSLHIGDAELMVPELLSQHSYDLVFIDANKRRYPEYYTMILPHLRSGAYIFADNTLWDNKVVDSSATDAQTEGIRRFNRMVADDSSVEKIILPIRDGLTIIRKK